VHQAFEEGLRRNSRLALSSKSLPGQPGKGPPNWNRDRSVRRNEQLRLKIRIYTLLS
jgi:hypothetical protein